MEKVLREISQLSIKLGDFDFTKEQISSNWLGNKKATEIDIQNCEKRLNVKFPNDYKEFLLICNGFSAPNDVEPSFVNIEKVDFLKNVDEFIIEAYDYLVELQNAIIVGGISEEQYFLLLPPKSENEKWKYWKFANWYPGEHNFENLNEYFKDVLEFTKDEIN